MNPWRLFKILWVIQKPTESISFAFYCFFFGMMSLSIYSELINKMPAPDAVRDQLQKYFTIFSAWLEFKTTKRLWHNEPNLSNKQVYCIRTARYKHLNIFNTSDRNFFKKRNKDTSETDTCQYCGKITIHLKMSAYFLNIFFFVSSQNKAIKSNQYITQ